MFIKLQKHLQELRFMRSTFAVTVIPVGHSITPTDRPIHKRTDTRQDSSRLDSGGTGGGTGTSLEIGNITVR